MYKEWLNFSKGPKIFKYYQRRVKTIRGVAIAEQRKTPPG